MLKKLLFALCLAGLVFARPAFSQAVYVPTTAEEIETDTTNFNGNLSAADTDVQKALDTLDNMSSGAPTNAHYLTSQAEAGLSAEVNLGALTTGLLKGTVAGGVSTISSVTDNSSNWDTAYGWGNHASAGYLTSSSIDTSAKLAAIVADETGSGVLVFATSPALVTPNIGVATATSIAIGANTLDTTEWAYLDGQDQAIKTTSNVTHNNLILNGGTVTLGVDTNFVLSGGVNGVSFDTDVLSIDATNNRVGVGTTTPSAALHIKAGTATASTAPLKLTAGTNLTNAEAGAIEFDGTSLYYTDSTPTRNTLQKAISVTTPITLSGVSVGMVNQGTTTQVLHGNAAGNASFGSVVEADLSLSDNTTGNFSTTKHGFVPKGTNVGNFLKDDGTWAATGGSNHNLLSSTHSDTVTGTGTRGDLIYYGASGWTKLAVGTNGQVLTTNGTDPSWGAAGSGANTALSNLATVAINTTLVSDTDNTDDLGSSSIRWKNLYLGTSAGIGTGSPSTSLEVTADSPTLLLIHGDGVDASTTFIDSSLYGRTMTAVGNAQIDTAQSKFGGASLLCDGTGDYITAPDSADWVFGTNNFTIETFVRFSAIDRVHGIFAQFIDGNNFFWSYISGTNQIYFQLFVGGDWKANYRYNWAPAVNTWYHLAFVRSGTTLYLFIDGTDTAWTATTTAIGTNSVPDFASVFYVGSNGATEQLAGWMDDFRVSKSARWTANFTPTTKAYGGEIKSPNIYVGERMGIGTTTPTTPLYILAADNDTAQTIKINAAQASVTAADTFIDFRSTTGSEGSVAGTAVAGVIAYNTLTGSHYTQVDNKIGLEPCMLLEIIDGKINRFTVKKSTPVFEYEKDIFGNDIEDITVIAGIEHKAKRVKSVSYVEEDVPSDASPKGQLFKARICKTRGSKSAIGVYGGTDKEGRDLCLSIGTGFVIVANKGKDIEIGDYLISSNVAGCAELQDDDIYRAATVAKATESVKWQVGEKERRISCILTGG
jgi:hypothetical protein